MNFINVYSDGYSSKIFCLFIINKILQTCLIRLLKVAKSWYNNYSRRDVNEKKTNHINFNDRNTNFTNDITSNRKCV